MEPDGYGPGTGGGHRDVLTELTQGDELRLLAANNIDLRQTGENGLGAMRAFVVGERIGAGRSLRRSLPEGQTLDFGLSTGSTG